MAAMLEPISIVGAVGQESQVIGKSRVGNTTKIHLAVDGCGLSG